MGTAIIVILLIVITTLVIRRIKVKKCSGCENCPMSSSCSKKGGNNE